MTGAAALTIILPAHNEADWIETCLAQVLGSHPTGAPVEIIVVANGCCDDTAKRATAMTKQARDAGMSLIVLDLAQGGKTGALNAGDRAASHAARVYLDADVEMSAGLLAALANTLNTDTARYASGTATLSPAKSAISRAYGRFWMCLPFNTADVGGYGIFAMNGAGRARWDAWPQIISDDTFARLNFTPQERHKVADTYRWPLVEGFRNLVRVRRRQNRGVAEIAHHYPELLRNDAQTALGPGAILGLALRKPLAFATYTAVTLAVRLGGARDTGEWTRGR